MSTQRERRPDQFRRIILDDVDDAPVVPVESPPADPVVVAKPAVTATPRARTTLSYIARALRRRDSAASAR